MQSFIYATLCDVKTRRERGEMERKWSLRNFGLLLLFWVLIGGINPQQIGSPYNLILGMDRDYEVRKTNKIYVSNLNYSTTEDDLRKLFEKYGAVKDVTLKQKESITFAFIEFDSIDEAEKAVNEGNGQELIGNEIKVYFAKGGNDRRGAFQSRGRPEGGYPPRNFDGPRGGFGGGSRACFNCGEEGHMIKDCPKPKKPREFNNREGGFERRPYDGNRGDREDRRGGYDRGDREDRRGGYDRGDRGDRERGGSRGGYREEKRGGYERRDKRSSSGSRSNDNKKGGRRNRSNSSGSR